MRRPSDEVTETQIDYLARLNDGDVIEVWWEAGRPIWRWRESGGRNPRRQTTEILQRRAWITYQRHGEEGAIMKIRHREGRARSVASFQITNMGRRALSLLG